MDAIDRSILAILQENARTSLKEISARVKLSQPAVSERLRKLERGGVIQGYTAIFNLEEFDRHLICFCLLILSRADAHNNEAFKAFIDQTSDILECHCVTGPYEYLLKIAAKNPKHLKETLACLRDNWGVVKSSTYTVLSTIKEKPCIGL